MTTDALVSDSRLVIRPFHQAVSCLGEPAAAAIAGVSRRSGRRAGVVLVYHRVGPPSNIDTGYFHTTHLFRAQLEYLKQHYDVLPLRDLCEAVGIRGRGDRFPVSITLDDDLRSHREHAVPLLLESGLPATFFLTGASLERPYSFWWERLRRALADRVDPASLAALLPTLPEEPVTPASLQLEIELLGPDERARVADALLQFAGDDPPDAGLRAEDVRGLTLAGMEIGFHTLRHDRLPDLSQHRLSAALSEGRRELEDLTGNCLRSIAYPHGLASHRVAAAARDGGFRLGFTVGQRPITPGSDPLMLSRTAPSRRSLGHFALQLAGTLLRSEGETPVPSNAVYRTDNTPPGVA